MIKKGGNGGIERGVQSELLGSSENGEGTAASRRKSSEESGGSEYFHKKLKKTRRISSRFIYPTKRRTPVSRTTGDS
jgi:hypothetical protein